MTDTGIDLLGEATKNGLARYAVVGQRRRDDSYFSVATFGELDYAASYARFLSTERPVTCKRYVVFDRDEAKVRGVVSTRHLDEENDDGTS